MAGRPRLYGPGDLAAMEAARECGEPWKVIARAFGLRSAAAARVLHARLRERHGDGSAEWTRLDPADVVASIPGANGTLTVHAVLPSQPVRGPE